MTRPTYLQKTTPEQFRKLARVWKLSARRARSSAPFRNQKRIVAGCLERAAYYDRLANLSGREVLP